MNNFKITIENIQHIKNFKYEFNLSLNKLHCIVGKNSVDKTTLIKIIENFKNTNILNEKPRNNIIYENSTVVYEINDNKTNYKSEQMQEKYILDSQDTQLDKFKLKIFTELPIPNGKDRAKCLFKNLIKEKLITKNKIFNLINQQNQKEVNKFTNDIVQFLNK